MKERLENLRNSEEIPPEDRDFVLEIYRLFKEKHSDQSITAQKFRLKRWARMDSNHRPSRSTL
jgi:hypothetical protein